MAGALQMMLGSGPGPAAAPTSLAFVEAPGEGGYTATSDWVTISGGPARPPPYPWAKVVDNLTALGAPTSLFQTNDFGAQARFQAVIPDIPLDEELHGFDVWRCTTGAGNVDVVITVDIAEL